MTTIQQITTGIDDTYHLREYLIEQYGKDWICHCTTPGQDAESDCEHYVDKFILNLPREQCIRELDEYGVWDDLEQQSDRELNMMMIWIAAGHEHNLEEGE